MSYKRCQDLEGTVPLSTRPTWSEWTSGTTSSSATWAGPALTNTSNIQTQVLIDHPGNFFIFFRVETLLRHAHFSIQSRRLWKQFDSEVRRLLNLLLLVQQENNGKHDFTHWQKAILLELSNKRRWSWAKELEGNWAGRLAGWQGWLWFSKLKCLLWPFLSTSFVTVTIFKKTIFRAIFAKMHFLKFIEYSRSLTFSIFSPL